VPRDQYHIPVLLHEVVTYLDPQPGGVYVDATFGGGGHTCAILRAEPQCSVIAFDWDQEAIERNAAAVMDEFPGRVEVIWANFARMQHQLHKRGIRQVQGMLADFGTSQHQIYHKEGFSFDSTAPLDMRMSAGHHQVTAAQIVNQASEKELLHIIGVYGEEWNAKKIVRAIMEWREKHPITRTDTLATLIARVIPRGRSRTHPATKTFQALRITVNKELDNIAALLAQAPLVIVPGGRLVCISFHSLEDRLVKQTTVEQGVWESLTKGVVVATPGEVEENPSSRSAKLRAFTRLPS